MFYQCPFSQEADKLSEIKSFDDKWKDLKSVSYGANVIGKPFFSTDTIPEIIKVEILFGPKKEVVGSKSYSKNEDFEATKLYNGEKTYDLYPDNTYYEYSKNYPDHPIFSQGGLIDSISYYLDKDLSRFQILPDTIIDGLECVYFKFTDYDKDGMYNYNYFCFEKGNYIPVLYKNDIKTELSKGDYSLGIQDSYSETIFNNIEKDKLDFDLAYFSLPSDAIPAVEDTTKLLGKGEDNPIWNAKDLNGKDHFSKDFKIKKTLLFLTTMDCPANELSINLLNKLKEKYTTEEIQFIGVFSESSKRLEKYIQLKNIDFPIIGNGKPIKKLYHAKGSPNFCLIDKDGKIYFSQFGYNDKLEVELINNIAEMDR